MHPYLTRLGVKPEVQEFFSPFITTGEAGNLRFDYREDFEDYGFAFHRVPAVSSFWMAGNMNFSQVNMVIVCSSAMEAVAWLNHYFNSFTDAFSILFLSMGPSLHDQHIRCLRQELGNKLFVFAFGKDWLGQLTALKLAAGLRGFYLTVAFLPEEKMQILFRGQNFFFNPETLSLNALERASGFRFRVLSSYPKNYNTFFEQLKAGAGLTF